MVLELQVNIVEAMYVSTCYFVFRCTYVLNMVVLLSRGVGCLNVSSSGVKL